MVLEMAQAGPVTNSTVRAQTGLDRVDVLGLFEELVTGGQLERVGSRHGTRYIIP